MDTCQRAHSKLRFHLPVQTDTTPAKKDLLPWYINPFSRVLLLEERICSPVFTSFKSSIYKKGGKFFVRVTSLDGISIYINIAILI